MNIVIFFIQSHQIYKWWAGECNWVRENCCKLIFFSDLTVCLLFSQHNIVPIYQSEINSEIHPNVFIVFIVRIKIFLIQKIPIDKTIIMYYTNTNIDYNSRYPNISAIHQILLTFLVFFIFIYFYKNIIPISNFPYKQRIFPTSINIYIKIKYSIFY